MVKLLPATVKQKKKKIKQVGKCNYLKDWCESNIL